MCMYVVQLEKLWSGVRGVAARAKWDIPGMARDNGQLYTRTGMKDKCQMPNKQHPAGETTHAGTVLEASSQSFPQVLVMTPSLDGT